MYEKGQYIVYGIRGVCQVADIITIDHPIGPKGRLYYELHPYNQKDGKIVTPVDSEKTITRLLLTRPEAEALIQEIPQIKEMTVANDKQREERYKEALKTCDCRVWVSMIKALYLRKQDRIEHKKKVTDLDERYFRMAEDYLNSELSLALDISKEKINRGVKATVLFYFIEKTACVSRRQFLYSDDLFDGSSGFASQAFFCLVQRSDDRLTAFSCL